MSQTYSLTFRLANECEHIGAIKDRLNCNCPNKWPRSCDLHTTTTIDGCLTCPDYLPDSRPPDGVELRHPGQ